MDTISGFEGLQQHASTDLSGALLEARPQDIHLYCENIGGTVQRAVYPLLNDFHRMVTCGRVAEYHDAELAPCPILRDVQNPALYSSHNRATVVRTPVTGARSPY